MAGKGLLSRFGRGGGLDIMIRLRPDGLSLTKGDGCHMGEERCTCVPVRGSPGLGSPQ